MSIREALFTHAGQRYRAIFETYSVRISNPATNRWRTGNTKTTLSVREVMADTDLVLAVGFLSQNKAAAMERRAQWSTRLRATECCKGLTGKLCDRCQRVNLLFAAFPRRRSLLENEG